MELKHHIYLKTKIAEDLKKKGWAVEMEKTLKARGEGYIRVDIFASKGKRCLIIECGYIETNRAQRIKDIVRKLCLDAKLIYQPYLDFCFDERRTYLRCWRILSD